MLSTIGELWGIPETGSSSAGWAIATSVFTGREGSAWFCYTRASAHYCVRARRRGWNYADACDTVRSVARSVVRSPSRSAVRSPAWRAREGNSLGVMGIRYQSHVRRCLSETCAECLSIGTRPSPNSSLVVAGRSYPNAERSRDKWIRDEREVESCYQILSLYVHITKYIGKLCILKKMIQKYSELSISNYQKNFLRDMDIHKLIIIIIM